jgi:hypothetical protein
MIILLIVAVSYLSPYIITTIQRKKLNDNNKKTSQNPMDIGINYDALLQSENEGADAATRFMEEPDKNKKPRSERLSSLDTYRGLSLTFMIYVNR